MYSPVHWDILLVLHTCKCWHILSRISIVNEHHCAASMCSDASHMIVWPSHRLGIWNYVWQIRLLLIHTIHNNTDILRWVFLGLILMFCIFFPLRPKWGMSRCSIHGYIWMHLSTWCIHMHKHMYASLDRYIATHINTLFVMILIKEYCAHLLSLWHQPYHKHTLTS